MILSDFTDFPAILKAKVNNAVPVMAFVRRVSDGDTVVVSLDRRFYDLSVKRLRVKGINAAELNTEAGKKAARFLTDLLPEGTPLVVTTHKQTYDRYEADILFIHEGKVTDLASFIVEQGYAIRA